MTFRRLANSIATRIILIGVLILTFGNAARYFTLSKYLREGVSEVVAAQQMTLANQLAREVDHEIEEREEALNELAKHFPTDLIKKPESIAAWLVQRHAGATFFPQGLGACLPDGTAINGPTFCNDGDLVRTAVSGSLAIGRPWMEPKIKQPVLSLAVPVRDTAGTVRAVLVGNAELADKRFLAFSDHSKIGKGGGFLLVSPRDRLFIAATEPQMAMQPTPPDGVHPIHDRAMQGYRGSGITRNAQGVEEIYAIASVPKTGWFVVARLPTEEALAVVSRTQRFVAVNSVLTLLGFLCISSVLLYFVFRPLLQAARQADRMTRDEAPLEPLTVVRQDEVGHLTEAFNRLLAKLRSSQSQLAQMAHHDPLTGLPNRALLADRLTQALARAGRHGGRVAFLCMDLDKFKPINDELGHAAGDIALKEVAHRWSAIVRESDTLARIGGDEFALLLADLDADPASAEQVAVSVAVKCLAAMNLPLQLDGHSREVHASIGIAMGNSSVSPHSLQIAADHAMYLAKHDGGQRYSVATAR